MTKYVVVSSTTPGFTICSNWFDTQNEAISFAMGKCDIDESYQVYSCECLGEAVIPDPEPVFLFPEN